MAYPSEHYLLAIGGPLGSVEEWTMTLRLSAAFADDSTPDAEAAALTTLANLLDDHWVTSGPISGGAKLGWAKYNRVGTDGRYLRQVTHMHEWSTPVFGPAARVYPHQLSLVATLHTAATRGLASKGRIYLPSPWYAVEGPDGTISSTNAQAAATWVARMIDIVNGVNAMGNVSVISKGSKDDAGNYGPGVERSVTRVSVGTVYDTMRSRRGKVAEVRSEAAVTVGDGFSGTF